MDRQFWKFLAYGLLISEALSIIVIIELIIWGKPFVFVFLLIFAATTYLNLRFFNRNRNKSAK